MIVVDPVRLLDYWGGGGRAKTKKGGGGQGGEHALWKTCGTTCCLVKHRVTEAILNFEDIKHQLLPQTFEIIGVLPPHAKVCPFSVFDISFQNQQSTVHLCASLISDVL